MYLLSLFLHCGQAPREVWWGEGGGGVLYRGNGLAIMKEQRCLRVILMETDMTSFSRDIDFPRLWWLSLICMNKMLNERKCT